LLFTEEGVPVGTIVLVAAVAVASIRMATYIPRYGQKLAKQLSTILPFTILAAAVLNPNVFSQDLFSRVVLRISEIPAFIGPIFNYLIFIVILEIILRLFEFLFSLLGLDEEEEEE